jgi:hypothetical protein
MVSIKSNVTLTTVLKHIAIPVITNVCPDGCCEREYMPLKLAFAKTIDTFQGQNAGPVDPGRPPNPVERIICDPGTRQFEGKKPGIFFTIVSRATTAGVEENGKRIGSAFYFHDFGFGNVMTPQRVHNLRYSPSKKRDYVAIERRDRWVNRLTTNTVHPRLSEEQIVEIFQWANATKVSVEDLDKLIIDNNRWRTKLE